MNKHTPIILSHSAVRYDDHQEDSATQALRIKLPFGWTLEDLSLWAHESFDTHCHHSYDCCGHWYRYLRVYGAKRVKSRTYIVTARYTQNI